MEGLLNLTMKPNEDTRDLLNWITDRMVMKRSSDTTPTEGGQMQQA